MSLNLSELVRRSSEIRHHALLLISRRFGERGLSESAFRALAEAYCGVTFPEGEGDAFWEGVARHPDVVVVDRARNLLRLEEVAPIRRHVMYPPNLARRRLFFIDRCERLNPNAANSLLKVLEEPSAKSLFLFTARSSSEVLPTIASRCQRLPFCVDDDASRPAHELFDPEDWATLKVMLARFSSPLAFSSWWESGSLAVGRERMAKVAQVSAVLARKYDADILQDGVVAVIAEMFAKNPEIAVNVRYVMTDLQKWRDATPFNPSGELWLSRIFLRALGG